MRPTFDDEGTYWWCRDAAFGHIGIVQIGVHRMMNGEETLIFVPFGSQCVCSIDRPGVEWLGRVEPPKGVDAEIFYEEEKDRMRAFAYQSGFAIERRA